MFLYNFLIWMCDPITNERLVCGMSTRWCFENGQSMVDNPIVEWELLHQL